MIQYISWLRVLAACLITNSHYVGIYPTDLIANGGLIGDILFFSISGYCLYNIKLPFYQWYIKRVLRIYIPVWLGTAIIMILGGYDLQSKSLFEWYIYPTGYHFVASIVLLYIPYYFVVKNDFFRKNILKVMWILAGIMLMIYISIYDTSYYHIDTVREPFIRFLFFESMLLGIVFRQNEDKYRNKYKSKDLLMLGVFFVGYFITKITFSKMDSISEYQIINQYLIFGVLFYILKIFAGRANYFENCSDIWKKIIRLISNMTLEIYIVQYVIIDYLHDIKPFPINWIIVTSTILLTALLLKGIGEFFSKKVLKK